MPHGPNSRGFIGRTEELAVLGRALDEARSGRSTAVVTSGDSGVGKTRLMEEFADLCRGAGARVLAAACVDFGNEGPSFWPFVDVMRNLARGPDAERVAQLLRPIIDGLGRPLQDFSHAIYEPATDTPLQGPHMFGLALEVLTRLAESETVVLIIEDLHWVDRSTRDLLRFLVANLIGERVLIACTYSSDSIVRGHVLQPLLVDWRRNRRVTFVELSPFSREEVAALLSDMLDRKPDPGLVDLTWERSGGNPFFAEQLAETIGQRNRRHLPASLHQVLLSRVEGMDPEAQEVLGIVAAAGEPVSHDLLASIVSYRRGTGDDKLGGDRAGAPARAASLLGALRECVDRNVLVVNEDDAYRFRHRLLADAVYDELLPGERRGIHAAYGWALAHARDSTDAVAIAKAAHHVYESGDKAHALPSALAAAAAMEGMHGYSEALHHYQRALDLWDEVSDPANSSGVDRATLLERAAQAADLAGEHGQAALLLRSAIAQADDDMPPERGALLRQQLGRYLWASGDNQGALEALQDAIGMLPTDGASVARARVIGTHAELLRLAGRYRSSRDEALAAVAEARAASSEEIEAMALATLGFDLAFVGDPNAGVTALERARDIAETIGTPLDVARAYLNMAEALSGPLNRLAVAVTVAERGAERARQLGLARSYGVAIQAIAVNTLFRLGRWDEAEDQWRQAFAHRPTGTPAIDLSLARARLAVGRGDFAAAESAFDTIESMSTGILASRYRGPLLTLRAGLLLWQHRPDQAGDAVAMGIQACAGSSDDIWLMAPLLWHGLRAEGDRMAEARMRRDEAAMADAVRVGAELLTEARRLTEESRTTAPPTRLAVAAYLDLCCGEWSRVEGTSSPETWEAAAVAWRQLEHPYPMAYARWRQAEALLAQRTQSGVAATALREAYEVACRLGAEPFRLQVAELAQRARIDLDKPDKGAALDAEEPAIDLTRRGQKSAAYRLTRQELNVLTLLAGGRSNREIAEQLFISEKTASVHVSHILAKLGLRTRVQAATFAHQSGLTGTTTSER